MVRTINHWQNLPRDMVARVEMKVPQKFNSLGHLNHLPTSQVHLQLVTCSHNWKNSLFRKR